MPDGVRLAVDVMLPRDLGRGVRLPTVMSATRYWRGLEGAPPTEGDLVPPSDRFWVSHGYAVVAADLRGTGASFGRWSSVWSPNEVRDLGSLIDWIVRQPWSDGRVGAIGNSYTANTAQLAAVAGRPALKAVFPKSMDLDLYAEELVPGGAWVVPLAKEWTAFVSDLDRDIQRPDPESNGRPRGVRPVDDDLGGRLLRQAVAEHRANASVAVGLDQIVFRDDRPSGWDQSMDEFNVYAHRAAIERSRVPIYGSGGWLDGATADGVIARFLTFSNPQRVVIGPWNHGATHDASPFQPDNIEVDPPVDTQSFEALCWFDHHVRGRPSYMVDGVITYFTMGEERWKETRVWPPANATTERWYLDQGHRLKPVAPTAPSGRDRYSVDFDATTGTGSRWITGLDRRDVSYGDRTAADGRLLVYTSAPFDRDVEITGNAIANLELASTAADGLVIVYLEDVDPAGRVRYLTEGVLRTIHRRISSDPPPYRLPIPYHSFRRKDAEPLVPGQVTTMRFGLFATSVLIARGHQLRLAIAGADRDNFPRIPADRTPVLSIERNRAHPSFIELPVISRSRARPRAARSPAPR
jgi:hypothetical protein